MYGATAEISAALIRARERWIRMGTFRGGSMRTKLFSLVVVALVACALPLAAQTKPKPGASAPAKPAASAPAKPAPKAAAEKATAGKLLDVNSASKADLEALPGIGEKYAQKIIDGRPYQRKDQLVSKKVIPQSTYDKVKDQLIATQSK
jgi:DNA uptake protein ComE-like DNA-binding protein